jgi:hypothetical protein
MHATDVVGCARNAQVATRARIVLRQWQFALMVTEKGRGIESLDDLP